MHKILLIPGDGIGLEVTPAAQALLRATSLDLKFTNAVIGASTQ